MARKKRLTTEAVLRATAVQFNLIPDQVIAKTRKRHVLVPRQIAQHIAWTRKTDTLAEIARKTRVIQHGTILHSSRVISEECELYADRKEDVQDILTRLSLTGYNTEIPKPKTD